MPASPAPAPAIADPTGTAPTPSITTRDLLNGQRRIDIEHDGQRYTLRVTRENKLILTK